MLNLEAPSLGKETPKWRKFTKVPSRAELLVKVMESGMEGVGQGVGAPSCVS